MKFYTKNWIHGSIRLDCSPEERSVFADLMALANESRNRGTIQANPTTPYPHEYLAKMLNIPLPLLDHCLKKFEIQERIHENETGIKVLTFGYYNPPPNKTGIRGRPPKVPLEQLSMETYPTWSGKPSQKALKTWQEALKELEREVSRSNYSTWFQKTLGLAYTDGEFIVGAPNNHIAYFLSQNQQGLIDRVLTSVTKEQLAVEYRIYEC